jgi:hypothetical protein
LPAGTGLAAWSAGTVAHPLPLLPDARTAAAIGKKTRRKTPHGAERSSKQRRTTAWAP